MQKYVKNEKRYSLINFICLLAVYKKLIGTGRVLGTSILRYVQIISHIINFNIDKSPISVIEKIGLHLWICSTLEKGLDGL